MTKEELEKEFEKYLKDSSDYYDPREPLTERKLLQMWLDCAEPREKQIQIDAEQIRALQKQNGELTDKLEMGIALKDEEISCILTDFNTFKSKAEEIIKELLNSCFGYNSKTVNYEVKAKAEQFLKENA